MSGARRVGGCLRVLGCLQVLCRRGRASVESGGAGPGRSPHGAASGRGSGKRRAAGLPRRVRAGSRRRRYLCGASRSRSAASRAPLPPPAPSPARVGGSDRNSVPGGPRSARGGGGARGGPALRVGLAGMARSAPAPGGRAPIAANGEPPARGGDPTLVSAPPEPGTAAPAQGAPQPKALTLSWARSRSPGHRRPGTLL